MRQVLRFESNTPQTVALEFPEGVNVPGQYGPQVRFSLTENRLMYLDGDVAQAIKTLGVEPGQPFTICKRWEKGRKVWWEVEKVKAASGVSEAIRGGSLPPTPSPAAKIESSPVSASGNSSRDVQPDRILPKSAPVPISSPAQADPPLNRGMQLTRTPPVKPSYEEAFRECLRIVREGLHDAGEAWSDHSVQAMTSTLFIQAAREGRVQFAMPARERVA